MKKIKASTLQESIIAMTIILICVSVGLMIFINVVRSDKAIDRLKANLLKKETLLITKVEKSFVEDEIERDGFIIKKNIYKFTSGNNCGVIEIIVSKDEKDLTRIKEIVIKNESYE